MVHSNLYERKLKIQYEIPDYIINYQENTPKIENIVTTVNTPAIVDLNEICNKIVIPEYRPERFAAMIIRISKEKGNTCLLYSTGKLLTAGSKRPLEALLESHKCLTVFGNIKRKIYKYHPKTMRIEKGYPKYMPLCRLLKFRKLSIANIVGKSFINKKYICLNEIHRNNRQNTKYSPTTFPAVRTKLPKCSASIFDTGYKLILGAKNMSELIKSNPLIDKMIMEGYKSKKITDSIQFFIWSITHKDQIDENAENISNEITQPKKQKKRFEKRIESHFDSNYTNKEVETDISNIKNIRQALDNFNIFTFEEKAKHLIYSNKF